MSESELISREYLLDTLLYDPDTGHFTWKNKNRGKLKFNRAGADLKTNSGKVYWRIKLKYRQYLAHRLAWLYVYGEWPNDEIDHIDGNGMNNAILNLRDVSTLENHKNKKISKRNTSGVSGVSWSKAQNKWLVFISNNKYLGCFDDFDDACIARKNAEIEHGYHKNHGTSRPL